MGFINKIIVGEIIEENTKDQNTIIKKDRGGAASSLNGRMDHAEVALNSDQLIFENKIGRYLNAEELSQWLSCTEKHVRNLVFRREIPFTKIGRLVRFNAGEVHKWLQKRSHA